MSQTDFIRTNLPALIGSFVDTVSREVTKLNAAADELELAASRAEELISSARWTGPAADRAREAGTEVARLARQSAASFRDCARQRSTSVTELRRIVEQALAVEYAVTNALRTSGVAPIGTPPPSGNLSLWQSYAAANGVSLSYRY